MACNPTTLLAASCGLSAIDPGLRKYAKLALLCQIMNGTAVACDAATLMEQAKCLTALADDEVDLVELVLLCNIMGGTVVA